MRLFEHPDFDQAVIRAAEHFQPRGLRATIAAFETQCRVLCLGPSPTWALVWTQLFDPESGGDR